MSQQNVELVVAAYERINRDRSVPRHAWHPDGEYVNTREDPDHATYRGHEEIEKLLASWIEAMELAHVITVEDGKIRRLQEYFDRTEGLAAAMMPS